MRELRKTFVDKFQKLSLWERASINSGILIKLNIYIYIRMHVCTCVHLDPRAFQLWRHTNAGGRESSKGPHIIMNHVCIYIYTYTMCVYVLYYGPARRQINFIHTPILEQSVLQCEVTKRASRL